MEPIVKEIATSCSPRCSLRTLQGQQTKAEKQLKCLRCVFLYRQEPVGINARQMVPHCAWMNFTVNTSWYKYVCVCMYMYICTYIYIYSAQKTYCVRKNRTMYEEKQNNTGCSECDAAVVRLGEGGVKCWQSEENLFIVDAMETERGRESNIP